MRKIVVTFLSGLALAGCLSRGIEVKPDDVVIENARCRLVLGADAVPKSLILKVTGEELLDVRDRLPLFAATQDRPFNNEIKLIHPNKKTTYRASSVRRVGETLIVGFPHRQYEARIRIRSCAEFVAFDLEDFICDRKSTYDYLKMDIPPVQSFRVLQLPIKNRAKFGDWLNASWDEKAAIGVVGTSPYPDIDHEERTGYRLLTADLTSSIRLRGAGAALIVAVGREDFLDCMAALEDVYDLPHGVRSRRSRAVNSSIFHLADTLNPKDADEVISFAKKGGFKFVTFSYAHIVNSAPSWGTMGDYDLRTNLFPNGLADVSRLLDKFKQNGISPGIHIFHPHIGLKSRYVTPVADPRLNKVRKFTLAEALPKGTNDIAAVRVYESTADVTRFKPCRVLQFGGELLSYESYTTKPPYKFLGVKRCAWNTLPQAHEKGQIGGILDVSEFGTPGSCYLDQDTDLQDEVAAKIAKLYACGFEYVYMDGSEGVNRPFNFHVANAQYRQWCVLKPEPLFAEGAAKTHFGWHMLSGANAFDCFGPSVFKEKLREFPFKQAPITWQDMTRVNFGWWALYAPWGDGFTLDQVGTQSDMWEYGTSVAAGWDCPMTILMPMQALRTHPRIKDILETMRRWEDVRNRGWLTEAQKAELRDDSREHHLLLLADGAYDLVRYEPLVVGDGKNTVRAFIFERAGKRVVVFWDGFKNGTLTLRAGVVAALKDEYAGRDVSFHASDSCEVIPVGDRQYLFSNLSAAELRAAFQKAQYAVEKGSNRK